MRYADQKRIGKFLWAVLLAVLCSQAVSAADNAPPQTQLVDRIVAVVNEEVISLYDLNQVLSPYVERIKTLGYSSTKERQMLFKIREDILNQLIDQKLTDQEIKRAGLKVGDKEIDNAIERIKESNFYTDEQLREVLRREGRSMNEYREHIKEQVLRGKLMNREVKSKIVITGEDVKRYYEKHLQEYGGQVSYHLHNIIMKFPSAGQKVNRQDVLMRMQQIRKMLESGESFAKLARMYSQSPAAAKGGDLGTFMLDDLSPLIQKSIKDLKPGMFTQVLDTDQGYQIFYVQNMQKTPTKPLKEVSASIEQKLYNEILEKKFRLWLEDLRKRSHINVVK